MVFLQDELASAFFLEKSEKQFAETIGGDGSRARSSGTGVRAGRNHLCYNFFRLVRAGAPKESQ